MPLKAIKIIMYISIAVSIPALIFWILGTTAGFQRTGLDLLSTVVLVIHWIPTLVLTIYVVLSLKNGISDKVKWNIGVVIVLAFLSIQLFSSPTINIYGWLEERVTSGNIHTTQDDRFEYRLDLINVFQRNSSARLFLRDLETGEEQSIALPMNTRRVTGFFQGPQITWITMESTELPYLYVVRVVDGLGHLVLDNEAYKVDIQAGIAVIYEG